MTDHTRPGAQHGFTLIELMVVVTILAGLALIAVPSITADDRDADFNALVQRFVRDVQRAHLGALSAREDRALLLQRDRYSLNAVSPGTPPVYSVIERRSVPTTMEIFALDTVAADPRRTYSQPTTALSGGEELRLWSTGGVGVSTSSGTAPADSSATVFFQTTDKKYRARVVIYQATSFAQAYEGW